MIACLLALVLYSAANAAPEILPSNEDLVALPAIGDHRLRVLTPTVLELSLATTAMPGGRVEQWDFADESGAPRLPSTGRFRVTVLGAVVPVEAVGFKRRVLY